MLAVDAALDYVASFEHNVHPPSLPGFQHFILQPTPDPTGTMTYAKGYYDSMCGRIESG